MNGVVEIVPIGGLGQFGMNCTLIRSGGEAIVVDVGMAFPPGDAWGIDAIVPDLGTVLGPGCRAAAIVLTHGHEDHIGGVSRAMMVTDCPVYGSDVTLGLLGERLRELDLDGTGRLVPVRGRDRIQAGPFTVEFVHVTHSVPGTFAIAVGTPAGVVVVGADFKLDPTPVAGPPSDLERLAELGRAGVRVLLLDSTNARNEGSTPSERAVAGPFARLLESAPRRILATTFSSHLHRVQLLAELAAHAGRRVAIVGRRMNASVRIGRETGHLALPAGALVDADEAMSLPPERVLIIAGGSQGEPSSAMTRIARGEHPDIRVEPGDTVVHSARPIPGNELAIARMLDALARRGASVLAGPGSGLHVSGHACADDLAQFLDLLAPGTLVPIHGTYLHLLACERIGRAPSRTPRATLVVENGDIIRVDPAGVRIEGRLERGLLFVDREQDPVGERTLRERRQLGGHGILVPLVVRERGTGRVVFEPGILARGFAVPAAERSILEEAARLVADTARAAPGSGSDPALEELVTDEVRRFVRRRTGKRPLVAPIVVEV